MATVWPFAAYNQQVPRQSFKDTDGLHRVGRVTNRKKNKLRGNCYSSVDNDKKMRQYVGGQTIHG